MQYDLFHVYTVDVHSLFVLRNLRRFAVAEFAHEFPLRGELYAAIPKPELLLLPLLFHDIAKGAVAAIIPNLALPTPLPFANITISIATPSWSPGWCRTIC
ncbi:MAG: hypothetical protein MZV65_16825 [Chromatiales bacterium]|nr:hypothetical protein [Chromatiales bacterium]